VAALGLTDVEIDVDAIDFDDLGLLLFSLQSDVDGTFLGPVSDGDVLRYEADGSITRVITEAEVQACFTAATGSSSAIGDVQAVEYVGGELWVATQGPSSYDGAVLSCAFTPYVVGDEAAIGLGGAELDSLSIVGTGDELATLTIDKLQAAPGERIHAEFRGAPGAALIVLTAGDAGYIDLTWLPGWGMLTMDPSDMWLQATLQAPLLNLVVLDASGAHAVDYALPSIDVWGTGLGGESGWSFQMVDLRTLEVSAPIRVETL
jgi:hypothetical protein